MSCNFWFIPRSTRRQALCCARMTCRCNFLPLSLKTIKQGPSVAMFQFSSHRLLGGLRIYGSHPVAVPHYRYRLNLSHHNPPPMYVDTSETSVTHTHLCWQGSRLAEKQKIQIERSAFARVCAIEQDGGRQVARIFSLNGWCDGKRNETKATIS